MASKARELANLGNAYSDGALSNRNLIINGAMQVAQRGTSATYASNTSRGYVLDRWYGEGYPLNATISQSTLSYDGIAYECASLSSITGSYYFYQAVENGVKYNKGKTLTLSFVASGSGNIQCQYNAGTVGTVNVGSAIAMTGTPTKYSVTFDLSGSATGDHLYVGFNGSGGSMNVSLVQVEVGDTATPFEHRSYGQELALAQRFFQFNGSEQGRSSPAGDRVAFPLHFSPEMRAAPTLTLVDSTNAIDDMYTSQRSVTGVTGTYGRSTTQGVGVEFSCSTTGNKGHSLFSKTLSFDAEL